MNCVLLKMLSPVLWSLKLVHTAQISRWAVWHPQLCCSLLCLLWKSWSGLEQPQKPWLCLQAGGDACGTSPGFWDTPDSPWGAAVSGASREVSGMWSWRGCKAALGYVCVGCDPRNRMRRGGTNQFVLRSVVPEWGLCWCLSCWGWARALQVSRGFWAPMRSCSNAARVSRPGLAGLWSGERGLVCTPLLPNHGWSPNLLV